MTTFAITLCIALAALAVWHVGFAAVFARILQRYRPPSVDDARLPFATILLPLRGADPCLSEGIRRLLRQDYPAYDIQLVIDHREDPAWELAQRILHETGAANIHVSVIASRSSSCSPQCSALLQAMDNLDERAEIVVIIDGDVLTHSSWLRELVTPLLDETIGITHGNRWFIPPRNTLGSLVRALWNAGAVVPMHFLQIPWAGSLAIRKSTLISSGLLDAWPRTIVPDAPAKKLLSHMGLSIRFVPSLMMINQETCSLWFAHDFMKRQMMWTRLYHPHWYPVVVHAVVTTLILAASLATAGLAAFTGHRLAAFLVGGCFATYCVTMAAAFGLMDAAVRGVALRRGDIMPPLRASLLPKLILAVPLTQVVNMSAACLATLQQHVTWRGITYRMRNAFDVTVVDDRPFVQSTVAGDLHSSL